MAWLVDIFKRFSTSNISKAVSVGSHRGTQVMATAPCHCAPVATAPFNAAFKLPSAKGTDCERQELKSSTGHLRSSTVSRNGCLKHMDDMEHIHICLLYMSHLFLVITYEMYEQRWNYIWSFQKLAFCPTKLIKFGARKYEKQRLW